jgi:hypothetical protein
MMTLKVILCQGFGECVSNLVFGVHRKDLDESLVYMYAKMMVAHVNVLGPRAKLRKPCQFQGTIIVAEDLTVHVGLSTQDNEVLLPHFL